MAFFSTERMTETETIAAFCDGASKAISAAKELVKETGNASWMDIASVLENMKESGYKLAHMKAMRGFEQDAAIKLKMAHIDARMKNGKR